jgi:hypothetical protein
VADTTSTQVTPKSLSDLVAEKEALARNKTMESLANYIVAANKKKNDLTNTYNKQVSAQDNIVAKATDMGNNLDTMSLADVTSGLTELANMAGGY